MTDQLIMARLKKVFEGSRGVYVGMGVLVVIGLILAAVLLLPARGDGKGESAEAGATPTPSGSRTPSARGTVAPTPASAGLLTPIAVSAGEALTDADLAARGAGVAGRGPFSGQRLRIPSIGVDAPFTVKVVGGDGQMPNPDGPEDVAWYDFSTWNGLGGIPGGGGNVILAGHVDYINYGPAVFWRIRELEVGDRIQIVLDDGTVAEYAVEFNKVVPATASNWSEIVAATTDESVTLITCIGQFTAGRYTDRQVVWGRRTS